MSTNRNIERIKDEQLLKLLDAVKAHIRRTRKHGGDTKDAEMELCYLEREEELRAKRKKKHEKYLKDMQKMQERMRLEAQEEEEAIEEFLNNNKQQGFDG